MTKKELLKILEKFDDDYEINIFHYYSGLDCSYYKLYTIKEIEERDKSIDITIEQG